MTPSGLVLDASQSHTPGVAPATVVWGMTEFPARLNASTILARLAEASDSLLMVLEERDMAELVLGNYTFTLSLRSAVGLNSTATHHLQASAPNTPPPPLAFQTAHPHT